MNFATDLIPGRLVKRYKRFLGDVEIESGEVITAHCPNPGAMLGLKESGSEVWLEPLPKSPKRKLLYTWQLIKVDENLVGVNTFLTNTLVAEALMKKKIDQLVAYTQIKREVSYGKNSRVDFLLTGESQQPCYLEVKNVHLKRGTSAEFPDCVTARGAKHLNELASMVRDGFRAIVLYVVQRDDCQSFKLADDLDPRYVEQAQIAASMGVESLCYSCKVSVQEIELNQELPM